MSVHRVKQWIVVHLEAACSRTHWFTWHRPWLWLPIPGSYCLLTRWSVALDRRWGTGVWGHSDTGEAA